MKDKNDKPLNTDKEKRLKNTPERIYIKANLQNYTFPKETYNERFISHLIHKKDYDFIIENASKILSQAWMKKRDNDKIALPPFVTFLSIISVILTIVYMILIYYSTTIEDGTALLVISIICVSLATLIAFSLSIYNFCRKMGTFKTVQEIIKEDLLELFTPENIIYKDKLDFSFNDEGNYLEIKILQIRDGLENFIEEDIQENQKNQENQEEKHQLEYEGVEKQNNSRKNSRQNSQGSLKVLSNRNSKTEKEE